MPAEEEAPSEFVRLNSSDGHFFIVKRVIAEASGTLKSMLDNSRGGGFMEGLDNSCPVNFNAIVAKVIEYLSYKVQYADATSKDNIPDFLDRIEPEMALELLVAADYLEA